jgi:hypothetical protein
MKSLYFVGLASLAVLCGALAQPSPFYINNGTITSPPDIAPQVYASNFVNNGTINIALNSVLPGQQLVGGTLIITLPRPQFDFSDVINYTNRGTMQCDTGFIFDTAPSSSNGDNFPRHMAASFLNGTRGFINAGSAVSVFLANQLLFGLQAAPQVTVSATNIVNAGVLDTGLNGVISVKGNTVDLSQGVVNIENQTGTLFTNFTCTPLTTVNAGIYDDLWGIGRGTNIGGIFSLPTPFTPLHNMTNTSGLLTIEQFGIANAHAIAYPVIINGDQSNLVTQVVFYGDSLNAVSINARLQFCGGDFPVPVIQWLGPTTNSYTKLPLTNSLYLSDFFGGSTNFKTSTNFVPVGYSIPTQSPVNFQYSRTFANYDSLFAGFLFDPTLLAVGPGFTNSYSGYDVSVLPITARPDPNVPSSTFSNSAGRVEITAGQVLTMSGTTITGPNYLSLTATNHFAGSAGAQLTVPVTDLNMASTNGYLGITNLVAPYVPTLTGTILAWSGQWTNLVNGVTNRYHVLMVSSALSNTAPTLVENFLVRSTNPATGLSGDVVVSDALNIDSNFLVNARSLTVTSNGPGASAPFGQINLLSTAILWSGNLPNVNYVTNSGSISTLNSAFFEHRQTPDFPSPSDSPYGAIVNHGTISTGGDTFWANYLENTGSGLAMTNGLFITTNLATIVSSDGPIFLQSSASVFRNGELIASSGDVDLSTGNLTISNHTIVAGGAFSLTATNNLNQTTNGSGRLWTNFIQVSDGFNLPLLPSNGGDLLGTTVTSIAPGYTAQNTWDGQDLGCSPIGFTNNMSLGHVIFDATTSSFGPVGSFEFTPANGNNAIYIDLISLADAATNHANNNYPQFIIDPGMKIYFGGALIGNADISEKLNGANGGAFCWVSNWNNGPFSSTNLLYPSGTNYSFNRALVASCDIDSNGNGIPNCQDPTPIPTPDTIAVRVRLTNAPSLKALVSWDAPAFSTNYLYTRTNLTSTSWLLVTNFIQGPLMTPVTITNQARTTGGSLYRVGISFRN